MLLMDSLRPKSPESKHGESSHSSCSFVLFEVLFCEILSFLYERFILIVVDWQNNDAVKPLLSPPVLMWTLKHRFSSVRP